MDSSGQVTASHGPATGVCTIIIPGWPQVPPLEARTDGEDQITIRVTRCHKKEVWNLVRFRKGKLCAIVYLDQRGARKIKLRRTVYDLVVLVPPERLEDIQVLTSYPGRPVQRRG